MDHPVSRAWAPDLSVGGTVLVLGTVEAVAALQAGYSSLLPWLIVAGLAVSVALVRRASWVSFAVLWLLLLVQALMRPDLMLTDIAVVIVLFGLARWGTRRLVWASGVSLPVATIIMAMVVNALARDVWETRVARNIFVRVVESGQPWQLFAVPAIASVLYVPWLAGLAVRFWGESGTARRLQESAEQDARAAALENAQMAQIARLREGQATLARDVHDVVGHSLTVILAQAESARFLDQDNRAEVARTLERIAASARSSLQEVRAVLATPEEAEATRRDLDSLIDTSRSSGIAIDVTDSGRERPLPPDLAAVAFRVLQELLTNAIRHGDRGAPIRVERDWAERLTMTVTNTVGAGRSNGGGRGIAGMQRRLESIGGSLTVKHAADGFTATAVMPVRARGEER
ncbi:sensor histidine kinase [Phytoactinopolyspora endophytica]|uniref:sensor histidine kinase n=1 Tax=Phytoactinopolyspora endophytica TaxID=1642495 RepID=UPI00101BC9F7|nr:histidine kinase [Phytoactinopolyspora endophytica]